MVLFGESDVDIEFLTDGVTGDLLLKTGNERAGTKFEVIVSTLAAFKSDTVDKALKVDLNAVAHSGRSVGDLGLARITLTNDLEFVVNFRVGNRLNGLYSLNTLVTFNGHFGLNGNFCRENDTVLVNGENIKFSAAHGIDAGLGESGLICVGKQFIGGIFIENTLAIHTFYYRTGSLTLAEAGDVDASDLLTIHFADGLLKSLLINGELKNIGALFGLFCFVQSHDG